MKKIEISSLTTNNGDLSGGFSKALTNKTLAKYKSDGQCTNKCNTCTPPPDPNNARCTDQNCVNVTCN